MSQEEAKAHLKKLEDYVVRLDEYRERRDAFNAKPSPEHPTDAFKRSKELAKSVSDQ